MNYESQFKHMVQFTMLRKLEEYSNTVTLECTITDNGTEINVDLLFERIGLYLMWAKSKGSFFTVVLINALHHSKLEQIVNMLADARVEYYVRDVVATIEKQKIFLLKNTGCLFLKLDVASVDDIAAAKIQTDLIQKIGFPVVWNLLVTKTNIDLFRNSFPLLAAAGMQGITESRELMVGAESVTADEWRKFLTSMLRFFYNTESKRFNLHMADKLWIPLLIEERLLDVAVLNEKGIRYKDDLQLDIASTNVVGEITGCVVSQNIPQNPTTSRFKQFGYPEPTYTVLYPKTTVDPQQWANVNLTKYSNELREFIGNSFNRRIHRFNKTMNLECVLTTECKNECPYCAADRHGVQGEIEWDTLITHINNYKAYAESKNLTYVVSLVGADNFLYSRFDDLIEYLYKNNIQYLVKGNASTLTKARAIRLRDTNCNFIKLSLYGAPEIHNKFRGLDTYDILVERTKMAQEVV